MITEEQRRALFALREALRLCEGADLWAVGILDYHLSVEQGGGTIRLSAADIDRLLAEHPE